MKAQIGLVSRVDSIDQLLFGSISRALQQSEKFSRYPAIGLGQVELYSDIGNNKIVYKVNMGGKPIIAIGLAREEGYDLYKEFKTLENLWKKVPEYFPEPYFYHEEKDQCILGMEFFPQTTIRDAKPLNGREEASIAYELGFALGMTYQRTGLINEEPHDDNVLVDIGEEGVTIKLIDAAHYREGTVKELMEAACEQQEICRAYLSKFRKGLHHGRNEA